VNLILFERGEVSKGNAGDTIRLSGSRADHLLKVLRVVPGHQVRVGILDGPLGVGTVQAVADDAIELGCVFDALTPARARVDLLLALPRPKVMRRLWAQIAALGVGQIILTNAERVERNYFDTHVLTPECYAPLLVEGLQQARDTRRPRVSIHKQLKVLIEDELSGLFPTGFRVVADPATEKSLSEVVRQTPERILLAVGPEGGWNTFEMNLFKAHQFQTGGLGPRTLRTDTACVAALAIVHEAMNSGRPQV
jgi:16S rRNA (uracil1498-N3)-methyltransferase